MKRYKKVMAAVLTASMVSACFAGCSQGKSSKTEETKKDPAGESVQQETAETAEDQGDKTAEKPGEKVKITWGVKAPANENEKQAYEEVVKIYNTQNEKNVEVKMNYVEAADDAQYNTWLSAQMMGGTAPEVVGTWYTPAVENYRKGLVRDLAPYLEKANPYMEESGAWKDTYADGLLEQSQDNLSDAIPSVPLATVAVKIFYNK